MELNAALVVFAKIASDAEAKVLSAPQGIGYVDWIVIAIVAAGIVRGFRGGLTTEMWGLTGSLLVVGVPFLFFASVAPWLQKWCELYSTSLPKPYADWLAFLGLTFLALLVYELVHAKFVGKANVSLWAKIESFGGAIAGGLRMAIVSVWLLAVVLLMPSLNLTHYFCLNSQSGYWLRERSPAIQVITEQTYKEGKAEFVELKRRLGRKEYDVQEGKAVPVP